MNLLVNAFTFCQIAVPPLCGYALDFFGVASSDAAVSGSGGMDGDYC